MSDLAKRPSCLVEGTPQYDLVIAGERYFNERNAQYSYAKRVILWILDDTNYYGSSTRDIAQMLRTMEWDVQHDRSFDNQLRFLDEFLVSISDSLSYEANERLYNVRGARRIYNAQKRISDQRKQNERMGWQ